MKKILFYYPQHFNRNEEGTNPFFKPLLETCQRHNISYRLYEEPGGNGLPHDHKAKSARNFLLLVRIVRKIVSLLLKHKNYYEREKVVAKIVNSLTLGYYKSDIYITISGSMFCLFASLNPCAQVYDLQHGILCKRHKTFFDQTTHKLRSQYKNPNLKFMLWGDGFKRILVKGDEEVMNNKVNVIGHPLYSNFVVKRLYAKKCGIHNILFSLQLTDDLSTAQLESMKNEIVEVLEQTKDMNVIIWMKHHPRYNNCIDISDLFNKYHHAKQTNKTLADLSKKIDLHLTFFSTSAFEYASYGIPTFFCNTSIQNDGINMFYDEFNYPLYESQSLKEVIETLNNPTTYELHSTIVKDWCAKHFSPYNESEFLKIVKINNK